MAQLLYWILHVLAKRYIYPALKRIAEQELPESCLQCLEDLLDIAIRWGLRR